MRGRLFPACFAILIATMSGALIGGCGPAPARSRLRETSPLAESDPPPDRREVSPPPPSPEDVWVAGHWHWTGTDYVWVSGRWASRPHARALWVPGHWRRVPRGWIWIEGHW